MERPLAAMLLAAVLAACASGTPEKEAAAPPDSAMCKAYGYPRGSEAYAQCAREVDKAMWRAARAPRARVNCTPMGNHTVCQ